MPQSQLAVAIVALITLITSTNAQAQFASPPEPGPSQRPYAEPFPETNDDVIVADEEMSSANPGTSLVRLQIGPAARFSELGAEGGLFAAVDIGRAAAGLRLAGSWVRVGSSGGAAQYSTELWLDFVDTGAWHPIIAAGAGLASISNDDSSGAVATHAVGVGLVRGSLQYALPVARTDARAALDVTGVLPAMDSADAAKGLPWAIVSLNVAVGF